MNGNGSKDLYIQCQRPLSFEVAVRMQDKKDKQIDALTPLIEALQNNPEMLSKIIELTAQQKANARLEQSIAEHEAGKAKVA